MLLQSSFNVALEVCYEHKWALVFVARLHYCHSSLLKLTIELVLAAAVALLGCFEVGTHWFC